MKRFGGQLTRQEHTSGEIGQLQEWSQFGNLTASS